MTQRYFLINELFHKNGNPENGETFLKTENKTFQKMDNRSLQKMGEIKDSITENRKIININYLNTSLFFYKIKTV